MIEAIELLQKFFDEHAGCWVQDDYGREYCFFCSENRPNHEPDCWYIEVAEYLGVPKEQLGQW